MRRQTDEYCGSLGNELSRHPRLVSRNGTEATKNNVGPNDPNDPNDRGGGPARNQYKYSRLDPVITISLPNTTQLNSPACYPATLDLEQSSEVADADGEKH
jgi:hypothetical protein